MPENIKINIINSSSTKFLPKKKCNDAIFNTLLGENITQAEINVIYVDDQEIHNINKEFLNHDYPTDVITFPLEEDSVEGEIYISADTAKMQAIEYKVSLENEIIRLAIHGTLHLLGYDDHSADERQAMHLLENKYLATIYGELNV